MCYVRSAAVSKVPKLPGEREGESNLLEQVSKWNTTSIVPFPDKLRTTLISSFVHYSHAIVDFPERFDENTNRY
jgi:hypothetical protein